MTTDPDTTLLGRTPGLDESHYEHDGLITKHAVRAVALAALRPMPGQLLWDLGTGAGSIAIEWCRADPSCRAVGVEQRGDRAAHARHNGEELTLPGQYEVREGDLSQIIGDLPAPDAIFIGGGLTDQIADHCIRVLPDGGRFVVHGVTMEAEVIMAGLYQRHGGELMRLGVENADHIGRLNGWKPARTITCWTWVKNEH